MDWAFKIDWQGLLVPTHSIAEMVLRGTATYIALFLIMRFFLKRQTGVIGIADLLVIVIIADAAQNGMAGEYKSITEGLVLVLTIVFWNYVVDWIGYRFPRLERLVRDKPLQLIRQGEMLRSNMEKEKITEAELMSHLRQNGLEDAAAVDKAFIEGDGRISVIKRAPSDGDGKPPGADRHLRG